MPFRCVTKYRGNDTYPPVYVCNQGSVHKFTFKTYDLGATVVNAVCNQVEGVANVYKESVCSANTTFSNYQAKQVVDLDWCSESISAVCTDNDLIFPDNIFSGNAIDDIKTLVREHCMQIGPNTMRHLTMGAKSRYDYGFCEDGTTTTVASTAANMATTFINDYNTTTKDFIIGGNDNNTTISGSAIIDEGYTLIVGIVVVVLVVGASIIACYLQHTSRGDVEYPLKEDLIAIYKKKIKDLGTKHPECKDKIKDLAETAKGATSTELIESIKIIGCDTVIGCDTELTI